MKKLLFLLFIFPALLFAQNEQYNITPLIQDIKSSFRGLAVVSDQILWISGSNGTVGKSLDGGKSWNWVNPAGFESYDFRDIQAFSAKEAVIVNAGSPAVILRTSDGGKNWISTYENNHPDIFLDGMDFWDQKRGIAFGDPIDGRLQLLYSSDKGKSWNDISANLKQVMKTGEASFAASGSTICTQPDGNVWIATGGSVSHIYFSGDYGQHWEQYACPITQGKSTTGVFSIAFIDHMTGVVVGGDYAQDKENVNNILLTTDGGKNWTAPAKPVSGFRSSVVYINKQRLFATGTSGTDVSDDGGNTWTKIADSSFNVIGKSQSGNKIFLTGSKGNVAVLQIQPSPK
ncbi:BNR/Asp-box repeat protein [Sphingobacterium spiritivorum ATCC 33300]|uniref:BNR/Asp-box repeat protein n=1 Tax=Sphingobacterium spiritivorum ATCC 33300 TaxID=525372 RepID=C2G2W0_SPHSI|nr:YCF48-related protein [Sphingobacterium spiritivorum]EEI90329.1 BNR/Asp-box repeat protein [Sphingobacterium spiritivorum ATCC 33300]QQS95366.1 oxidoreductase [Sphingobacterium spiritivorum]